MGQLLSQGRTPAFEDSQIFLGGFEISHRDVQHPAIHVGLQQSPIKFNGAIVMPQRLFIIPLLAQGVRQVVVGFGETIIDLDRSA
jgi:hypothetical protein